MPTGLKRQKERMWNNDPHCERCGVLTILAKDAPGKVMGPDGHFDLPYAPPNLATIQHRYSKTHPRRLLMGRDVVGERRRFLWCYKCNQEYNDMYESPVRKNKKLK